MYQVQCPCGRSIPVELYQAGTAVECPQCRTAVSVPSSTKLKIDSGDKNPLLSPLEKIAAASATGEFPFQGECHCCHAARATFSSPVEFHAMVERVMLSKGGAYPISLRLVVLTTGEAEEQWATVRFPLLLCGRCQSSFVLDRRRSRVRTLLKNVVLFGFLGLFLILVFLRPEEIVAISGLISLVGVVAWVATLRDSKKGEAFLTKWLKGIRWVPEMIRSEQEYSLRVGESEPLSTAL